jgi:hypothetical protein
MLSKVMVAVAAIAFSIGCENDGVELNGDFTLDIAIEDVTETSAKVKVTHNGDKGNSWYGLLTTDITSEESALVKSIVKDYLMDEGKEGLHSSNRYIELIENLTPCTEYRYIAFGMTTEGKTYGQIASTTFTTLDYGKVDTELMQYNNSWLVQYTGAGTLYEQPFDHIVSVLSNDQNPYAITVVEADKYDPEGLMQLATDLRDAINEYIDYYNSANGTAYRFADMLFTGNASDAFDLEAGEYRAVVLGYTYTGEVSGLYAVSEPFEAKMPLASEAYKSWLGTWTVIGANSVESIIELKVDKANKSCLMTGWEGFEQWPVKVDYESSLNSMFFSSQLVATDVQVTSTQRGDIYFLGGDKDGYFYSNDEGDYEIAIAGILDDGVRAIVRYGVNMPNYPKFTQMFYMAKIGEDYYTLSEESEIPTFISAMTPGAKPKALSAVVEGVKTPAMRNKFTALRTPLERNYRLTRVPRERIK